MKGSKKGRRGQKRERPNPYPAKRACRCDRSQPVRDVYGEVRCMSCGHPPE